MILYIFRETIFCCSVSFTTFLHFSKQFPFYFCNGSYFSIATRFSVFFGSFIIILLFPFIFFTLLLFFQSCFHYDIIHVFITYLSSQKNHYRKKYKGTAYSRELSRISPHTQFPIKFFEQCSWYKLSISEMFCWNLSPYSCSKLSKMRITHMYFERYTVSHISEILHKLFNLVPCGSRECFLLRR